MSLNKRILEEYGRKMLIEDGLCNKASFSCLNNFLKIFICILYYRNNACLNGFSTSMLNLSLPKLFNLFKTFIPMLLLDESINDIVINFDQKKNLSTKKLT
jgi:hypothetical protein